MFWTLYNQNTVWQLNRTHEGRQIASKVEMRHRPKLGVSISPSRYCINYMKKGQVIGGNECLGHFTVKTQFGS